LVAHRQVEVDWNSNADLATVIMTEPDAVVTTIELGQEAAGFQIASGSLIVDENGERQATLLFPNTATAALQLPDGTFQLLSTLNIRLTEYTAGALPADMPASLYSYAFEANADEALSSGGVLEFSEPLTFYVDNFLAFPVGTSVPLGYYSQQSTEWSVEDSGLVIEILSITDGLADIDTDGDGLADSATALTDLGIGEEELATLAELYPIGQSLWRSQLTHFSSLACIWAAQ
jgi:hypothetical protein